MFVTTETKQGKKHTTECSTLFEALELIDGLLILGPWKSVTLDGDEFIEERAA